MWYISTLILGQHGSDCIPISSIPPCDCPSTPELNAASPTNSGLKGKYVDSWRGPILGPPEAFSSLGAPPTDYTLFPRVALHEVATPLSHVMSVSSIPHGYGGFVMPVREGCSFSIRIARSAGVPVHGKTSVTEWSINHAPCGCGAYNLVHAPDTEANSYGRALLFADDHTAERKAKNPRPRIFPSRAVLAGNPRHTTWKRDSQTSRGWQGVKTGQREGAANRKE